MRHDLSVGRDGFQPLSMDTPDTVHTKATDATFGVKIQAHTVTAKGLARIILKQFKLTIQLQLRATRCELRGGTG